MDVGLCRVTDRTARSLGKGRDSRTVLMSGSKTPFSREETIITSLTPLDAKNSIVYIITGTLATGNRHLGF